MKICNVSVCLKKGEVEAKNRKKKMNSEKMKVRNRRKLQKSAHTLKEGSQSRQRKQATGELSGEKYEKPSKKLGTNPRMCKGDKGI